MLQCCDLKQTYFSSICTVLLYLAPTVSFHGLHEEREVLMIWNDLTVQQQLLSLRVAN